jgi:hypothetical protein
MRQIIFYILCIIVGIFDGDVLMPAIHQAFPEISFLVIWLLTAPLAIIIVIILIFIIFLGEKK